MVNYYINTLEAIPVVATDLQGNFVGRYNSQNECQRELGISNVAKNLSGESFRCGKYMVMYEKSYNPDKPVTYKSLKFKRKAQRGLIKTSTKRNIIIK